MIYGIIVSAIYTVVSWFISNVVVRILGIGALYFLLTEVISALLTYIFPTGSSQALHNALNGLDPGVLYFFQAFGGDIGVPLLLSAMSLRFVIRRLPLIG